jgi:hypothetical protein
MPWLRHFALFVVFVTALFRPAAAGAFVSAPDAGSQARVGAFELVAATLVGPASAATCGLHEGIGRAYDENASGYRFAAGGGRAALAARFGTTAERTAVLERAITAEGGLNTSTTVARQLAGQRSFIPTQSVLDTIASGARVADPQGVAGQFMYRSAASFNGSQGTLEVLVHEASGQIRHVLFRSGVAP